MTEHFVDRGLSSRTCERRRAGCDWASAITAFCRGTGLTDPACYRVLTTVMDVCAGRPQFEMGFVAFGKRMAGDKAKSDEAYHAMTHRDLGTLEAAQTRTGFCPLIVNRGDRNKGTVSKWSFPGLNWIEQILARGTQIWARERRKEKGLKRKACFDSAFNEIAQGLPRKQPGTVEKPARPCARRRPLIKSIGGMARRLRRDALEAGATEAELSDLFMQIVRQVDWAFGIPEEALWPTPKKNAGLYRPPAPPVVNRGDTGLSDELSTRGTGDKTVGENQQKTAKNRRVCDVRNAIFTPDPSVARVALDYVLSVGVTEFAVLIRDDYAPKDNAILERLPLSGYTLKERFQEFLELAVAGEHSLIVDLRAGDPWIVQVDECTRPTLDLLAPVSLLQILTSDGNGQSIISLSDKLTPEECKVTKQRLFGFLKPLGANRGASGAARWPGSFNFKPIRQRADGSFPMVRLLGGLFGRYVTIQELEAAGLLAPSEATKPLRFQPRPLPSPETLYWPDYDIRLSATDRSAADFKFCTTAAEIGWPSQAIEEKLCEVSPKAHQRSPNYAAMTVRKAIEAVENRPGRAA